MNPEKHPTFQASERDRAVVRQSHPEDYDGHTHFDRMSPADRLAWLETAVQFVSEAKNQLSRRRLDHATACKETHG